jgi:hypothetical protein
MAGSITHIGERTDYLDQLCEIETRMDDMEREEVVTYTACALTCKICQCVECAKIPGGDV